MKKKKFLLLPVVAIVVAAVAVIMPSANADSVSVTYSAHVQNVGDQAAVTAVNDTNLSTPFAGTSGRGLRIEALKVNLKTSKNLADDVEIQYITHIQNIGWAQGWKDAGETAGTSGQGLRLEAIAIVAPGLEDAGYVLKYRAHIQNIGWQEWKTAAESTSDIDLNDVSEFAGTSGQGLRMEAIQIAVVSLDSIKAEAKAELKAFTKSTELKAKTADGEKNADTTKVKAVLDDITDAVAKNGDIDKATTVDDIEEIVSKLKEDTVEALQEYLLDVLGDYDNETEVLDKKGETTHYVSNDGNTYYITEDDYEDAVEAIEESESLAGAISAFETAMNNRQNISEIIQGYKDQLTAYINGISELSKKEAILSTTGGLKVGKDTKTYLEDIGITWDKNEKIYEAASGDLKTALNNIYGATTLDDDLDEYLEDAKEAIIDAVAGLIGDADDAATLAGKVYEAVEKRNITSEDPEDADLVAIFDDLHDALYDAFDTTTTFAEDPADYINAYETYLNSLTSIESDALSALKDYAADELDDDFKAENYTIKSSEYKKAYKALTKALSKITIKSYGSYSSAAEAVVAAYVEFASSLPDSDEDIKEAVNDEITTKTTALLAGYEKFASTKDTRSNSDADKQTPFGYSETVYSAYDTGIDKIENATTKDKVDSEYGTYAKKLYNAVYDELVSRLASYKTAAGTDQSKVAEVEAGEAALAEAYKTAIEAGSYDNLADLVDALITAYKTTA